MHETFGWAAETPTLFTATFGSDCSSIKHYMVVEAMPQGGWDWVAWANDGSGRCLHDACATRGCAMKAAEHAASLLALTHLSQARPVSRVDRVLN